MSISKQEKLGQWAGEWAGAISGYAKSGRTFYSSCVACDRQIGSDQQATRRANGRLESIHVACIKRSDATSREVAS